MLSCFAKWCFTATAVAPALGAASIIALSSYKSWPICIGFAVAALLSVVITFLLMAFVKKQVQQSHLVVDSVDQADQKVLEFLLAYLLPVFSATSLTSVTGSLALTIYSLVIVFLTVAHGNILQFNPVLAMFGYHFYEVRSEKGIAYLLITRRKIHKAKHALVCKHITDFIVLDVDS